MNIRAIEFACGHQVNVPILSQADANTLLDNSYHIPLPEGVGVCRGCQTLSHKHDVQQRVIGITTRTEYYTPSTGE